MPQQNIDLGSVLKLYDMFSPDAQARTQLLQQQVQNAPQLNQAQIDALNAEVAQRTSSAKLTGAQADAVGPESAAALEVHKANVQSILANTKRVQDLTPAEVESLHATIQAHLATAAAQNALTGETNTLLPAKLEQLQTGTDRNNAEVGHLNAQTAEVSPTAKAQQQAYLGSYLKDVIGGVAPMIQDKNVQGALINTTLSGVPGVAPAVAKINQDKADATAKLETSLANLHKSTVTGTPVGPLLPADAPYADQVNQAKATEDAAAIARAREALFSKYAVAFDNAQRAVKMPSTGMFAASANAKANAVKQQLAIGEQLKALGVDITTPAFKKQLQDYGVQL